MKWQLVPVEPTEEMLRAHGCNLGGLDNLQARAEWAALLAAAPKPTAKDMGEALHDELQASPFKLAVESELVRAVEWDLRPDGVALTYQLPDRPNWPRQVYAPAELAMPYDGQRYNKDAPSDVYTTTAEQMLATPGGRKWAEPDAGTRYRALVDLLEEVGVLQLEDDWARQIQALVSPESKDCPRCGGSGRTNRCFTCKPVTPEEL